VIERKLAFQFNARPVTRLGRRELRSLNTSHERAHAQEHKREESDHEGLGRNAVLDEPTDHGASTIAISIVTSTSSMISFISNPSIRRA
jgi:hypothetical protein